MKIRYLLFLAPALFCAGPAQARQVKVGPPSGIVIHLFGPGSVTSGILPSGSSVPNSGAGTSAETPQPYVEPTTNEILHQMFVTGDPNLKPGQSFPVGRTTDHP